MAEDLQRLLLGFLFLTGDKRDDVADHFRPVLECLSGTGDCLIRGDNNLRRLELHPRRKSRRIGLNRAVRLDSDEAACCSKSLPLVRDDCEMVRVDFRNNHRHIRSPAVSAVVGDNRCLCLRIFLLNGADLVLAHIDSGKYKVNICRDVLDICDILDNHLFYTLRHRCVHLPLIADSLFVCLSGTARGRGERFDLKPRMICEQRDEALSDHSGCTQDTDFQFITHDFYLLLYCQDMP